MENFEESLKLKNYDKITRADSALSQYDNYRISYKKRKKPGKAFSVILIQLLTAVVLTAVILLFRFVPAFEPAFNAVKDFIQKDILDLYKSIFNGA